MVGVVGVIKTTTHRTRGTNLFHSPQQLENFKLFVAFKFFELKRKIYIQFKFCLTNFETFRANYSNFYLERRKFLNYKISQLLFEEKYFFFHLTTNFLKKISNMNKKNY